MEKGIDPGDNQDFVDNQFKEACEMIPCCIPLDKLENAKEKIDKHNEKIQTK